MLLSIPKGNSFYTVHKIIFYVDFKLRLYVGGAACKHVILTVYLIVCK